MLTQLVDDLKMLSAEIQKSVDNGDFTTDELIDVGLKLDTLTKVASKTLDPIKVKLRQEAISQSNQQAGDVDLGSGCLVRIPKPKVVVRKNYSMGNLKSLLGSAFSTVFNETTTFKPQKDFQNVVSQCDPAQQKDIMAAVEMVDDSPKVFFKE